VSKVSKEERWNERTMERKNDRTIVRGCGKSLRLNALSTNGAGSNSPPGNRDRLGKRKRNPGYRNVQRKRRNYRFLLVAVSLHPAHLGI